MRITHHKSIAITNQSAEMKATIKQRHGFLQHFYNIQVLLVSLIGLR